MKRDLSFDLILYAVMLAILSVVAHRFSPHYVNTILPAGIGGASLSALLGSLGLLGYPVRRWAIFAVTVLCFALLAQAVVVWKMIRESDAGIKPASHIPTVLWLFAVGQLSNLIQNRGETRLGPETGPSPTARKVRR